MLPSANDYTSHLQDVTTVTNNFISLSTENY